MLIGARSSPLSRAQVEELKKELNIDFDTLFIETTGDLDKKTSLRNLEKTDFFTRELDELLLSGHIDAAIHSAKDLPDPLPKGLKIIYLSKGLDQRDSLVYVNPVRVVATSSHRREDAVRKIYPDCQFVDLRGTIHERLARIGVDVDGVVVAECALIRLGLTHMQRYILSGTTVSLQGRLAVVAREDDTQLEQSLFSSDRLAVCPQ